MIRDIERVALAIISISVMAGCAKPSGTIETAVLPEQRAGQPMNPATVAVRLAAARAAGITGDEHLAREQIEALNHDFQRSMKIPDSARRIPREPARAAARAVSGVKTVVWLDTQNLLVRVNGPEYRNNTIIDQVCRQLEPLGDTLGTVINLQDASATSGDGMATLSRDCQLQPGDRAFLQQPRQVDIIDPTLRAQHRNDSPTNDGHRPASRNRGDQDALNAIPEV